MVFPAFLHDLGRAFWGPPNKGLSLFLPGPGHEPLVLPSLTLASPEPLIAVVRTGATLIGRVVPRQAVEDLLEAGRGETSGADGALYSEPGFALWREERDGARARMPATPDTYLPLAQDGTFAFSGVPAGTWRIDLHAYLRSQGDQSNFFSQTLAVVDLPEERIREIEVDLSHLLTGVLEGSILHNGVPLREEARLFLIADRGLDAVARARRCSVGIATDGQGRFRCRVPHGVHTLEWVRVGEGCSLVLRAVPGPEVIPGRSTQTVFHFRTARLRLRLLDIEGMPLPGVPLLLGDAGEPQRHRLAPTDHDGWTEAEVEAGLLEVRALLPLGSPDGVPRVLGTLAASMGATLARELRLPAE